jgi:hypothetical protein
MKILQITCRHCGGQLRQNGYAKDRQGVAKYPMARCLSQSCGKVQNVSQADYDSFTDTKAGPTKERKDRQRDYLARQTPAQREERLRKDRERKRQKYQEKKAEKESEDS